MRTRFVGAAALAASVGLCAQTSYTQQDQAELLQILTRMQQSARAPAPAPPFQQNLSPEQMQLLVKLLASSQNTDPAVAMQLMRLLTPANPGQAGAPAAQGFSPAAATARQNGAAVQLAAHSRESVFVRTKSNDVADALKAQALSEAINLGAAAAARKIANGVPYMAGMSSIAGRLNMFGGGRQQGWEFEFVRGISAGFELKSSAVEFVLPPATAIPGGAAAGFQPVLVKLRPVEKDRVRIIAARKVRLAPASANAFGRQDGDAFDREILSVEYESVQLQARTNPDGSITAAVPQNLPPGEYAIVLQRPEPKTFRLLDTVFDFKVVN